MRLWAHCRTPPRCCPRRWSARRSRCRHSAPRRACGWLVRSGAGPRPPLPSGCSSWCSPHVLPGPDAGGRDFHPGASGRRHRDHGCTPGWPVPVGGTAPGGCNHGAVFPVSNNLTDQREGRRSDGGGRAHQGHAPLDQGAAGHAVTDIAAAAQRRARAAMFPTRTRLHLGRRPTPSSATSSTSSRPAVTSTVTAWLRRDGSRSTAPRARRPAAARRPRDPTALSRGPEKRTRGGKPRRSAASAVNRRTPARSPSRRAPSGGGRRWWCGCR